MKARNTWIYYLIPVMAHLSFLPFWFFENSFKTSLIEILFGTTVVPIYLNIISYKHLGNFSMSEFFRSMLMILAVTILGIAISYLNWGISTGNLLKPDSETIFICGLQTIAASAIGVVGWIAAYIIKIYRRRVFAAAKGTARAD